MLAALAVEPKPGMNVLDACAAPGGKSALIAETMADVGRVYAWDVHEHRVELIRAAKQRLKLDSLRPAVRDARKPYADFDLYMDAVLVDAPCSGLGVIADKPDIKYRFTDAQAGNAAALCRRKFWKTAPASSGWAACSIYSTCTILPEENEQQVRAFLEKHPEFVPETNADYLPEPLRARCENGMAQFLSPPRPRGGLSSSPACAERACSMERTQLLSLTQEELRSFLRELDPAPFRAKQVGEWLARGAAIGEMTNLPAALRARLAECAVANPVSIRESFRSKLDDTQKRLYELADGNLIEGVVMRYHYGDTLCLSTQVGCRMGCPLLRLHAQRPRARTSRRGRCWGRCWR